MLSTRRQGTTLPSSYLAQAYTPVVRGALLTGDIAMATMDRRWVSFMYSFPNYIPLNATAVRAIWRAVEPLAFDRLHGAWWGRNIETGARTAFDASVRRYLAAISG